LAGAVSPEHEVIAFVSNELGFLYCFQGRYQEAEALFRRALEIRLRTYGPESLAVAQVLANQAIVMRHLKRKGEAKKLEARARAILTAHSHENHEPYTVDISALLRTRRGISPYGQAP
jgi:Tfp pilus assembly protein PilF